jgi:hypothetical protein
VKLKRPSDPTTQSPTIIAAVESVTCARGRAHRAGSRTGKAANRERFFADRTLQIREDYFIGEDVLRVGGGRGKRYTEEEFERRFRMSRSVFNEIWVVVSVDEYFQTRSVRLRDAFAIVPLSL